MSVVGRPTAADRNRDRNSVEPPHLTADHIHGLHAEQSPYEPSPMACQRLKSGRSPFETVAEIPKGPEDSYRSRASGGLLAAGTTEPAASDYAQGAL